MNPCLFLSSLTPCLLSPAADSCLLLGSSYRTIRLGILAEHTAEVEGARIFENALETAVDLCLVEPSFLAKIPFHFGSNRAPRLRKVSRNRGLVLLEDAAGLGERQLLRVVAREAQAIPRAKRRDRDSAALAESTPRTAADRDQERELAI